MNPTDLTVNDALPRQTGNLRMRTGDIVRYDGGETWTPRRPKVGIYVVHATESVLMMGYTLIRDLHGNIFAASTNLLTVCNRGDVPAWPHT